MRFGQPVDEISVSGKRFLAFNSSHLHRAVWLLADALNAGLDEVTATVEAVAGRARSRDLRPRAARWNHGGAAVELGGPSRRRPLIEIEALWTVGNEYPKHWPKAEARLDVDDQGEPVDGAPTSCRSRASARRHQCSNTSTPRTWPTGMQILETRYPRCAPPRRASRRRRRCHRWRSLIRLRQLAICAPQ